VRDRFGVATVLREELDQATSDSRIVAADLQPPTEDLDLGLSFSALGQELRQSRPGGNVLGRRLGQRAQVPHGFGYAAVPCEQMDQAASDGRVLATHLQPPAEDLDFALYVSRLCEGPRQSRPGGNVLGRRLGQRAQVRHGFGYAAVPCEQMDQAASDGRVLATHLQPPAEDLDFALSFSALGQELR
jgi:hypothetical protein